MRTMLAALRPHTEGDITVKRVGLWGDPAFQFVRKGKKVEIIVLIVESLILVGDSVIMGRFETSIPKIIEVLDRA